MSSRLWLIAGNYDGKPQNTGAAHVVLLGTEILRLGWETKTVVQVLMSHKNHTFRWFTKVVRGCAVWLRRHDSLVRFTRQQGTTDQGVWAALVDTWIEGAGFGPSGAASM